jgi:hypothetical protein
VKGGIALLDPNTVLHILPLQCNPDTLIVKESDQ